MKFFLRLIEFFVNIFGGRKKKAKAMSDIPKDNYPMF
jgi:hypothetical protein